MTTEEKIIRIVADHFGADEKRLNTGTHLHKDLRGDSLDSIEIVMAVEKEFGKFVKDEDLRAFNGTIGDIVDYIEKKVQ